METPELYRDWANCVEDTEAHHRHKPSVGDVAAALHDLADLLEAHAKLRSAIRWALGYDEGEPQFESRGDNDPPYWWRKELRRRADFPREESNGDDARIERVK